MKRVAPLARNEDYDSSLELFSGCISALYDEDVYNLQTVIPSIVSYEKLVLNIFNINMQLWMVILLQDCIY